MNGPADALVLGCGFLGHFLLAQLRGRVVALTRTETRHRASADDGVEWLALDLAGPGSAAELVRRIGRFSGDAWLLVPPSGLPRGEDVRVLSGLWDAFRAIGVRRAVMASSTGVYGDHAGGVVTSATAPVPVTEREQRLLALEKAWLSGGEAARVVRLGGLYGPGRVIGRRMLEEGASLPGSGDDWLNLVRAEDAAAALIATATVDGAERVGLITDGSPVRRGAYYGYLARAIGAPAPVFGGSGRFGGSRRCDPASTWAALGRASAYPDYRSGLRGLLGADDDGAVIPG